MARNITIFGVDSPNSVHATNKTQNILILGHGLTQKINNTTIYVENMYSPNFSAENKTFCLRLHYMAKKLLYLKPKILKLKQTN